MAYLPFHFFNVMEYQEEQVFLVTHVMTYVLPLGREGTYGQRGPPDRVECLIQHGLKGRSRAEQEKGEIVFSRHRG